MENHRAPRQRNGTHHDGGYGFECSGRSCAAAMIADCVALCCCPCAVVNFLVFAFVKVPWAVGRRCLAAGKRKRKKKKKNKLQETTTVRGGYDSDGDAVEDQDSRNRWWKEEGILGISPSEEDVEAERIWLELYQIGHLGFGRLSFTGIQPQLKGN